MKGFVLVLFLILFSSCAEEHSYPDVPIPKEQLINILIDLSLAQGAVSNYKTQDKDSMNAIYRFQIQKIYGLPMKTIDSSLNVIYQDAKLNREIQQIVLDSLKRMEEKAGELKNKKGLSEE
jgi:hypothetical protein